VQADATSGTFMFTLAHSDIIRIQLYVRQDVALDVTPGTHAVVRAPEMPGREFPGQVTRIADALQPGTRTLLTEIEVPNPDHGGVAMSALLLLATERQRRCNMSRRARIGSADMERSVATCYR
jgi:hypothetical protein